MNTEFDFPLCEFNRNNPTFLEILRKNVMIYDKDIFEYFRYIFFRNIFSSLINSIMLTMLIIKKIFNIITFNFKLFKLFF